MFRMLLICFCLTGCGGVAWNTTVADHPQVRDAMLRSVVPGKTTEHRFVLQWGQPTQKMREGGQVAYIYRNMKNPPGYVLPQYGNSGAFVIVLFQYGVAIGAYSSDTQGCRATFAPRPPGYGYDNPTTIRAVNCGVAYDGSSETGPLTAGIDWLTGRNGSKGRGKLGGPPMVPGDDYPGGKLK